MLERITKQQLSTNDLPACDYDELDHLQLQQQFVTDLLEAETIEGDILDLGTGTAWIPVLLCQNVESCRIMAADLSGDMLEQARYNIEIHGVIDRVQLDQSDAREMLYKDQMFDAVISHRALHEFDDPLPVLKEALRVTNENGLLFFRDFLRPESSNALDEMIERHTDADHEHYDQHAEWFRQSLQAALTLGEIQELVMQLGFGKESVQTNDASYWTWFIKKGLIKKGFIKKGLIK